MCEYMRGMYDICVFKIYKLPVRYFVSECVYLFYSAFMQNIATKLNDYWNEKKCGGKSQATPLK